MIKLFVVEDEPAFATFIKHAMKQQLPDIEVVFYSSAQACLDNLFQNPDIISADYNLPDMNGVELMKKIRAYNSNLPVIILSGQEQLEVVIDAYQNGAHDYILKKENAIINLIHAIQNISSGLALQKEIEKLREQIIDRNKYSRMIGNSKAFLGTLKLIQKVENTDMTVLITGESGTGKELVAKAIHYNSPRKRKAFITVNMAAIPEDLIESELFGHEKGAFTDASGKRIGKFEEANEGTIFLDEIGEIKLDLQSKLLRVLEEKEVTRIGSNKTIKMNIRIIAATNKNLFNEVKEGRFRKDLFYRLQGFLIQLPQLKLREDDVVLLAKHFLKEFCTTNRMEPMHFSKEVIKDFLNYSWPGNIRELKSVVERAALLAENKEILPEDLIFSVPEYQ